MSNQTSEVNFSKLRGFFWPIHNFELKKFLPMAFMQFFIIFVYTTLRGTKDSLVITAGGSEVIPFLKGYFVFPSAVLFVLFYSKLVDYLSKEKVFYTICTIFLSYFALFSFVIFPNRELFHPSAEWVRSYSEAYPSFKYFFSILGTWSFATFYIMAELWGSTMNALLFWQFANEIVRTEEAKRFYGMFILISNFSMIFSGISVKFFSSGAASEENTVNSILFIGAAVLLSGLVIMWLYRWVRQNVLTDPRLYDPSIAQNKPKKKKVKLSAGESMKLLFGSKYLAMIALLVLSYGISINLIELLWKEQLKKQFLNITELNAFMGNLFIGTGIATIIVILVSKSVVMRFGWFWGAIMTPIMILVSGMLFFGSVFFSEVMDPVSSMLGISTLFLSVWLGTIQNILSKSIKYGLFDPTKEMAYIPLEDELKVKGKAAVDVIGARLGKASGGYISSGLIIIMGASIPGGATTADIAPFLSYFIIGIIGVWIYAVFTLAKLYKAKLEETGR